MVRLRLLASFESFDPVKTVSCSLKRFMNTICDFKERVHKACLVVGNHSIRVCCMRVQSDNRNQIRQSCKETACCHIVTVITIKTHLM